HLLSLINDLLELAKIEAGKLELKISRVDLKSVVEDVALTLAPQAQAKGLELAVCVPEEDLSLNTDRRAVSQIVINLANNALKFTESGSVRIKATHRAAGAGKSAQISVEDTGTGIRAEDQAKLFAAFSRVNTEGQQANEGTGLGLHLSQKLAELLGGRITLRSEYGGGSTFTLELPDR
ncbi:MAG: PAS domain-containing sensor histidine kinase, partial [Betaproteobacteria bacterium]|nr:PAS domain-containing sensor histidine kinase [Betaproteobacteria bacterium]